MKRSHFNLCKSANGVAFCNETIAENERYDMHLKNCKVCQSTWIEYIDSLGKSENRHEVNASEHLSNQLQNLLDGYLDVY